MEDQSIKDLLQEIKDKDMHIIVLKHRVAELERMPKGQNTGRTLIDVMNHYLNACPVSCRVSTWSENHKFGMEVSRNGALVFRIDGVQNVQCCYEEFFEFMLCSSLGFEYVHQKIEK